MNSVLLIDRSSTYCLLAAIIVLVFHSSFSIAAEPTVIARDDVLAVMAREDRLPGDRERDVRSRPEEIIPLLNLRPGDRVVDIFGSGGYYSELLAGVLGEEGEAVLHNSPGFEAWGVNILNDRFTDREPGNITRLTINGPELGLNPDSLDAAIIVMALHDLYVIPKRYNGEEYVPVGDPADVDYFFRQVFESLRDGGRFVVIDHAGDPNMAHNDVADLHRIKEDFTRSELKPEVLRSSLLPMH